MINRRSWELCAGRRSTDAHEPFVLRLAARVTSPWLAARRRLDRPVRKRRRLTVEHPGVVRHNTQVGKLLAAVVGLLLVCSCSVTPATKSEVCKSFDDLGTQFMQGNGIFGNPLFRQAATTGHIAKRYPDAGVQRDGEELLNLGDADSMSGDQLEGATAHIANLCGHPLGLG